MNDQQEPNDEVEDFPEHPDLPPAFNKALCDNFFFALGLRNGQVIEFATARLLDNPCWVHLVTHTEDGNYGADSPIEGVAMCLERGIDVRVDDIAWVADAPHGS